MISYLKMSRHLYKQYIRLVGKWPKDQYKNPDRDLANFLPKMAEKNFVKEKLSDPGTYERQYQSLEKIYLNEVHGLYPHKYTSGVFGLTLNQLQDASREEIRKHFGLTKKSSFIRSAWSLLFPPKNN